MEITTRIVPLDKMPFNTIWKYAISVDDCTSICTEQTARLTDTGTNIFNLFNKVRGEQLACVRGTRSRELFSSI